MKKWNEIVMESNDQYIGKIFYQEYENGDKSFFKPVEKLKNGNYKGIRSEKEFGKKASKAKNFSSPMPHLWKEIKNSSEIPESLK